MLHLQPSAPNLKVCEIKPLEAITHDQIEDVERRVIEATMRGDLNEGECELRHTFAPGVYVRELLMPAGNFVIGHEHKTTHVNVVVEGRAYVMMGGKPYLLEAPHTFVSEAGVRKVLYILEDMRFITIHPTQETEIDKLEEELIVKSDSFKAYESDLIKFRELLTLTEVKS